MSETAVPSGVWGGAQSSQHIWIFKTSQFPSWRFWTSVYKIWKSCSSYRLTRKLKQKI